MDTSREEAKKWFTKEAYEENEMDELASQLIHAGCINDIPLFYPFWVRPFQII